MQVLPALLLGAKGPCPSPCRSPCHGSLTCTGETGVLMPEADFCGFKAFEDQRNGAQASEVPEAGLGAAQLTSREGGT